MKQKRVVWWMAEAFGAALPCQSTLSQKLCYISPAEDDYYFKEKICGTY